MTNIVDSAFIVCQHTKSTAALIKVPLTNITIGKPWEIVGVDIL